MSDFAYNGRRARMPADSGTIESRIVFGACFVLFLGQAVARRLMRRGHGVPQGTGHRQSIFREARSAAEVVVVSSFMGL